MDLVAGSRLGPYEIVSRLGAGGMGEVFKARDTRLGRHVAIKVLPALAALDARLQERFEREARAISQLNHPNICTLYDVGRENETTYLVMELLEGESLLDRLARGPMSLSDVLRYAAQIADALHRAHVAGIVHRDLKPGNIMITKSGAKLLDFGLARSGAPISTTSEAPTEQFALTAEHATVGTLPYMSPEQLQGQAVDSRSDLFAFGAVLFEMITRRRAFNGPTATMVVLQIVEQAPPRASSIQKEVPPKLEHVVVTCLQKNPDERFQCAADIATELRWIASAAMELERQSPAIGRASLLRYAGAGALAVAATVIALAVSRTPTPRVEHGVTFTQLTYHSGEESHPTVSPDGKMFAFVRESGGQRDIFLQRIGGQSAINLTSDSTSDDHQPAFSPDGSLIAFRSERDGGGLFIMGATGESVRRITDRGYDPAWSPDGKEIVFSAQPTVDASVVYGTPNAFIVDIATGSTRLAYGGNDVMQPTWSPDGQRFAFWSVKAGQRDLFTISRTGERSSLQAITNDAATDWNPVWAADGKHLYFSSDRDGTFNIWRVRMDESRGTAIGEPEPFRTPSPHAGFVSLARDGTVVYQSKVHSGELLRIDFDPATEALTPPERPVFQGSMNIRYPAASPNGQWIAFATRGQTEDVYLMNADGTGVRQLTNDVWRDRGVAWWPDGSRIIFYSNRGGTYEVWSIRRDGSGLTRLTRTENGATFAVVSPDERRVAVILDRNGSGAVIDLPASPSMRFEIIPDPPVGRFQPESWSPDGKWLAGGPDTSSGLSVYSFETKKLLNFPVPSRIAAFIDHRRILFVDDRLTIGIVDVQTQEVRKIGSLPVDERYAIEWGSISTNGRSILIYRTRKEGDIWKMSFPPPAPSPVQR